MLNELKKQLSGTTGNLCGLAKEVVSLWEEAGAPGSVPMVEIVERAVTWYGEGGVARPGTPKWQAGLPIYKELMDMKVELESQVSGVEPHVLPESVIVNVEELSSSPPKVGGMNVILPPEGGSECGTTTQGTTQGTTSHRGGTNSKSRRKSTMGTDALKERIAKLNGDALLVEISSLRGKLRDAVVDLIGAAGIRRKGTKWARIKDVEVDRLCRNFLYYWESGSNNKRTYGRLFGEAERLGRTIKPAQSLSSVVGSAIRPLGSRVGSKVSAAISTLHEGTIALTEKAMVQSQVDGARLIEAVAQGHREAQKTHYKGVVSRAKDKRFLKLEAQYLEVKLNQQLAKEAAKDLLSE